MKKDKARDIARGVLPSTARKGARAEKREFHATHRSAQRQVNHAIQRHVTIYDEDGGFLYTDPDLFDDFTDLDTFDGYHAATTKPSIGWDGMGEIVSSRRNADKLGPLIAWATATEKSKMVGWSVEDKRAYFKAILPDSLQGRHALGHVESALDLYTDVFYNRYSAVRHTPQTKEKFRAGLARHLSSTKGRAALHEHILDTVPVAAHSAQANNKVLSSEQARDENGNLRYLPPTHIDRSAPGYLPQRPHMVDVYVPQVIATTCEDCAFLRNDPLATTETVNRFVEIVWLARSRPFYDRKRRQNIDLAHHIFHEIFDYVIEDA